MSPRREAEASQGRNVSAAQSGKQSCTIGLPQEPWMEWPSGLLCIEECGI